MAQILIDVTRLICRKIKKQLPTGIDRVCISYIKNYMSCALAAINLKGKMIVLSNKNSFQIFEMLIGKKPFSVLKIFYLIILSVQTSKRLESSKKQIVYIDVNHSNLNQKMINKWISKKKIHLLFFLHDLIPVYFPEYSRVGVKKIHLSRVQYMLKAGAGIITNSSATKQELLNFAYENTFSQPVIFDALLASGIADYIVPGSRIIHKPYFIMLGTIEPRKNHLLILHVWRHLINELGKNAPVLVIIGRRGWECENVIDILERCEILREFVFELNDCSDQLLVDYLAHAQALLFPSFTEGHGMPIVESLSYGVPVIASNLSVFYEIANNIPEYIDPIDGKAWVNMIKNYINIDSPFRLAQLKRIKFFKKPSWDEHFSKVDKFIRGLNAL